MTPINQDRDILKEYLNLLQNINTDYLKIDFMFIDDNTDKKRSKVLKILKKSLKLN